MVSRYWIFLLKRLNSFSYEVLEVIETYYHRDATKEIFICNNSSWEYLIESNMAKVCKTPLQKDS